MFDSQMIYYVSNEPPFFSGGKMCEGVDLPHFDKSVVTQAWSCQLFLQIKMGSHTASEWKKLD